jgi:hypothetical protein
MPFSDSLWKKTPRRLNDRRIGHALLVWIKKRIAEEVI